MPQSVPQVVSLPRSPCVVPMPTYVEVVWLVRHARIPNDVFVLRAPPLHFFRPKLGSLDAASPFPHHRWVEGVREGMLNPLPPRNEARDLWTGGDVRQAFQAQQHACARGTSPAGPASLLATESLSLEATVLPRRIPPTVEVRVWTAVWPLALIVEGSSSELESPGTANTLPLIGEPSAGASLVSPMLGRGTCMVRRSCRSCLAAATHALRHA